MNVTFASSGALSRAHYAIVRKVEEAASAQEADQALAFEIKRVHERLARAAPTIRECKECLVILLYISSAASPGFFPPGKFEFALAHALNLIEVGRTVEEKRIGYLFCAELMPAGHELRLMMVNTLRKDLESGNPSRMCLALDNLIAFSNEDIIPAVQDVVLDLISHNYPHIRRRAILTLRSLAAFEPGLLLQASGTVVKRLQDRNESVASSALAAASVLSTSDPNFANARLVVNGLFSSIGISSGSALSLRILQCLQSIGLSETHTSFALDLIKSYSSPSSYEPASLLGLFRLLSQHTSSKLIESEDAQGVSAVKCLTNLLQSQESNDHYLYLSCLLCVDPAVWAGTQEGRSLVLEGWEVEKVMGFLESPDNCIRKMTLTLLTRIDPAIVSTYLNHVLSSLPSSSSGSPTSALDQATLNLLAVKLLDIVEILAAEDGEPYARGVKEVLGRLDEAQGGSGKKRKVLQAAVEKVLVHIRGSIADFRISCAAALLTYLAESSQPISSPTEGASVEAPVLLGPSLLVISAALTVEYVGAIALSPKELVDALCMSLKISTPIVQDALLISILRLAAEIPPEDNAVALEEVKRAIEEVKGKAGAFIQKRCAQVLSYLVDDGRLRGVVRGLGSATLPEFVQALEHSESKGKAIASSYRDEVPSDRRSSSTDTRSRSRSRNVGPADADVKSPSPSKSVSALRYTAYEPPKPMASLRFGSSGTQRPSSPQVNKVDAISRSTSYRPSSSQSDTGSSAYGTGRSEYESAAVEAASLGLAALSLGRLDSMDSLDSRSHNLDQGGQERRLKGANSGAELVPGPGLPRSDLISLDSPFVTEATAGASGGSDAEEGISSDAFEKTWDELPDGERGSQRGWCDESVAEIVRRLQEYDHGMRVRVAPVDVPPYAGEVKVMLVAEKGKMVGVRLKVGEEDSCLWKLKSNDLEKASAVRAALVSK